MKSLFLLVLSCFIVAASQAQKVPLALNLEVGKTYKLVTESQTDIAQEIMGQKVNTLIKSNVTSAYLVKSADKRSYQLEVRFEHLLFTTLTPQGVMEFQSGKEDAKDAISTILNSMINQPFVVELGKNGRVISVLGIQEIFAASAAKFPNLSLAHINGIKTPIINAFGEEIHKSNLNLVTSAVPGKSVSKGVKWADKSVVQSVVTTDSKSEFELVELSDAVWNVKSTSTLVIADKKKLDAALGTPMKYDLTGNLKADIKVDSKTGWTRQATINEELTGIATMDPTASLTEGLTIPTTIKTTLLVTQP